MSQYFNKTVITRQVTSAKNRTILKKEVKQLKPQRPFPKEGQKHWRGRGDNTVDETAQVSSGAREGQCREKGSGAGTPGAGSGRAPWGEGTAAQTRVALGKKQGDLEKKRKRQKMQVQSMTKTYRKPD